MTVAAVVPLAAAAAAAVPASAAGGYTVTATIPVGSYPADVATDSAAGTVYVANNIAGTVSVIDAATNAVTATIPVGSGPFGVAVDSAAGTVYVTDGIAGTVSVIDAATNAVTATITVPTPQSASAAYPYAVAVDPAAGTVYVANGGGDNPGTLVVIDAATNAVTANIPVGYYPEAVAVDPVAGTVYVSNSSSGSVSVIDEATNTVTATIELGIFPRGVAVDPVAGTVYVAKLSGGPCPASAIACVMAIDAATNAVTAAIPVGSSPIGVAVDPSTHTVYAANSGEDDVSVISPGQAPTITSADSTSIGMRAPLGFTVTTTGIPVPALTETGALPAGLTFTDNGNGTASLSGMAAPGTAGSFPITITASNGVGSPATQAFTLTVTTAASAPAITSDPADAGMFGTLYGFTVTTTGYPVPKISKTGTMPPGVHFADNGDGTATISGTPDGAALGPYTVTLTAKNKAGKATQSFTLTIWAAPVIAAIPTTTATIGTAMDLTITATGYDTPVLTESGTLPKGLTFTSTGNGQATISGTPARNTNGSRAITITATNQVGTVSQTFTLKVRRS